MPTPVHITAVPTATAPFVPDVEESAPAVVRIKGWLIQPGFTLSAVSGVESRIDSSHFSNQPFTGWNYLGDTDLDNTGIDDDKFIFLNRFEANPLALVGTTYNSTGTNKQITNGLNYVTVAVFYNNGAGSTSYVVMVPINITNSVTAGDPWTSAVDPRYLAGAHNAIVDSLSMPLVTEVLNETDSGERLEQLIYDYILFREIAVDVNIMLKKADVLKIPTEQIDGAFLGNPSLGFGGLLSGISQNDPVLTSEIDRSGGCRKPSGWYLSGGARAQAPLSRVLVENSRRATHFSRVESFRKAKDRLVVSGHERSQYSEQAMLGDLETSAAIEGNRARRREAQKAARRNLIISLVGAFL